MGRKIYVASSWRNEEQNSIVQMLRANGHQVYDFKEPAPDCKGFSWSEIDPKWQSWTSDQYFTHVTSSVIAAKGFQNDMRALHWCDTCLLLLPCGRSAHLEAGWAVGAGKQVVVLLNDKGFEPELMYLMCHDIVPTIEHALEIFNEELLVDPLVTI